jgi:hypothetical protein
MHVFALHSLVPHVFALRSLSLHVFVLHVFALRSIAVLLLYCCCTAAELLLYCYSTMYCVDNLHLSLIPPCLMLTPPHTMLTPPHITLTPPHIALTPSQQVLEVNPSHPLIVTLNSIKASGKAGQADMVAAQLLDNALISAGLVEDPRYMVPRLNDLLLQTMQQQLAKKD